MHFFSPANVMRLLEVVEGAATGAATQATAMSLARRLGQKTGAGVYRYEPGDRTPREDVEVLRLIERFRAEQGVMSWAEREGLATIQARLLDFHDQTGEAHWRPADGLNRRLAEAGAGGERP